jgi:hypothetical protein
MFVLESIDDLWDHIAYVLAYALDKFPFRDFLSVDEQMTLERPSSNSAPECSLPIRKMTTRTVATNCRSSWIGHTSLTATAMRCSEEPC